jgi:hypothetical protein
MPISFDCPCGKNFTVGDEYAGKRTKCPACGAPLVVPTPEPEPEPVKSESEEDAAYRALMEAPEAEAGAVQRAAPPGPKSFGGQPSPPARPAGPAIAAAPPPKLLKPSAEERQARKERRRERRHDPERTRKILYMVGGVLLVLLGGAIGFFAINEGISIRAGVLGFFMVFGGISAFFQGLTGKFNDE